MEFNNNSKYLLLVGIVFCGFIVESFGHSYVTSPQSRSNQKQSESGCRGPACLGPCDVPLASMKSTVGTYSRGQQITIQWPRNNHAGGFIRFAWALTSQSDSMSAFDTHVAQINCHEVGGCGPSDPSNPNGGDNGTADGSYRPCQTNITVPGDLVNGGWTLQWAWFGGAFFLGDYYSCVDYTISGGPTGTMTPVFIGGDYTYPGQDKCKFFNTDMLHQCIDEPCSNPIFTAGQQQSGTPAYNFATLNQPVSATTGSIVDTSNPTSDPDPSTIPVVESTGATESSTGATESSTGSVEVSTGSSESSTSGDDQSSTGATESSTGAAESSTGSVEASTGAMESSTSGDDQSSTSGNTESSTGSAEASATGAMEPTTTGSDEPVTPAMPTTTGMDDSNSDGSANTGSAETMEPATTGVNEPISTPTPVPTPAPSTGCVLGDMFCVGTNQYQTCTNGREANYYAAPQTCQPGLSCHPSATENKIYCY